MCGYPITAGRSLVHTAVMAEHAVENHIDALLMGLPDEFIEFIFRAEFGVYLEIIGAEISGGLKLLATLSVGGVEYRCHPDGIHAEILYIVERVDDAAEVTVLAVSFRAPHVAIS